MSQLQLGVFGRSRSLRHVRQSEIGECGLACLVTIADHYGFRTDLAAMRRTHGGGLRGASLKSLIASADAIGLAPRPVKLPLEALANLHLPAILHWNFNHFVVLERISGTRALICDPAGRRGWRALSEISDHFSGVALELRPAPDFLPKTARETLSIGQLWTRTTGLGPAIGQTLLLTALLQLFVLIAPLYMQIGIDSVLPALDTDLLVLLAIGFAALALINAATQVLRSYVLLSAGASFGFGVASNVARHLFRLPVPWFQHRSIGDVLSRFQSVRPIQQALTEGTVSSIIDGSIAVLVLVAMFLYSAPLAAAVLVAFLLFVAVRALTFPMQRQAQEDAIAAGAREQSVLIESLRGILPLRLYNREAERHALWQNRCMDATNAGLHAARIGIWQGLANGLIFGFENVACVAIGIALIMSGELTVGMLLAFFAYKGQFVDKASRFIDQLIAFRIVGLHLERLSDIALEPVDAAFLQVPRSALPLIGTIEARGVSFRYGRSDPLVLTDISFRIDAGEHIAVTGPSGGGKSTLAKLLLGLMEPTAGSVLVDGRPLAEFGHANFRRQVAAVLQDDHLFAGSVAENIALFDDAPDFDWIEACARMAALHDDIMATPMGYETLIGDMGSSLSGGQKARLLLARALYRRPRLLVLDEATAHLDPQTEAAVSAAVSSLGITRIVIAHRSETIRHADRVLRLFGGQVLRDSFNPTGGKDALA